MKGVVVAAILACAVVPARADNKAKAAEHYRQGIAFKNAKAYDDAIAEFEKAYALDKASAHLFNIGITYEEKKDLKNALDYFQRYLTAEPKGPKSDEARTRIKTNTQQLVDAEAKRRDEEARIVAEQKKVKAEQEAAAKKAAVLGHVKQAAAYAQVGTWAKAGEEHLAAAALDGDPQHLLAAAAAFHKQPDDVRARKALLAYLEKVPTGDASDRIRVRVAELTKSIEKAEADRKRVAEADHQHMPLETAKPGIVVTTPVPRRHLSFGFDLRGGIYGPGSSLMNQGMEVQNRAGPAVGLGALIDLPVFTASHIHLGVRARYFRSGYDSCGGVTQCPSKVSGTHAGPAITLEPSIYHGRVDIYAILGFSLELPLGKGKISFQQGPQDQDLKMNVLASPEAGLGVRFGPVSISAVFQISVNAMTYEQDLGQGVGIIFAAGWSLPR